MRLSEFSVPCFIRLMWARHNETDLKSTLLTTSDDANMVFSIFATMFLIINMFNDVIGLQLFEIIIRVNAVSA